jgi:hypothetical protein
MNVFREMFDNDKFESLREFTELQRMLRQAIERGYVEEVPVTLKREVSQVEHWYRDKETGDIYSLTPPESAARGCWGPVNLDEYQVSSNEIQ